ncbi:lysine 2,3-aminomutase, partial [Magnetococcales bacterium HHB-1]
TLDNLPRLQRYLKTQPQVTDLVFTGGDPLIMDAATLSAYITPLLKLVHIKNFRIGTKALSYHPDCFLNHTAAPLLTLFKTIMAQGKQLALMVNINHPQELSAKSQQAIHLLRQIGITIRTQTPLLAGINDQASVLQALLQQIVQLGSIPYYIFIPRNTGPEPGFRLSLARAVHLIQKTFQSIGGLAKTVRGPVMSTQHGKVHLLGIRKHKNRPDLFIMEYLQARDPRLIRTPFFAPFNPSATWFNELEPASKEDEPFFKGSFSP